MKRTHCIFSLLVLLAGLLYPCQNQAQSRVPDYLNTISNRADFDRMKGKPLSNNYNGIECIKVIYELRTDKIYYIESRKYTWHYSFVTSVLFDEDELDIFNKLNYGRDPGRKYILATFNYNTDTKNYFLQFAPPDDISDEMIDKLVAKVSQTFFLGNKFKILLNTTTLLRRKKELAAKHDVITGDDLFQKQSYQPVFKGKVTGILRFVDADSIRASVDYSRNILVIRGNSNQIPVCRGIITDRFQTPLSHICLLTANRKTPCAFKKGCYTNDSLRVWKGRAVELSVGENTIAIKPAAQVQPAGNTTTVKTELPYDTAVSLLADLKTLELKNKSAYGVKTCNLAELKRLERKTGKLKTPPDAFGIPFHYYAAHLRKYGIDTMIQGIVLSRKTNPNDSILDIQLKAIRKMITRSPIDTELLRQVNAMCLARFGHTKVRFRSSSNCEDGEQFNGAGLYTSVSGRVGDTAKSIEKAIKKVWASLWNTRAYKERDYFGMDHSRVLMAVLVHGAYDHELVNGVAITKNLYRNYEVGFVINMQKGEAEVVSPDENVISEQVISYMNSGSDFYNEPRSADWISYSSLSPGGSLLSKEELYQLTLQLENVKRYFYGLYHAWPKTDYKNFGMDVEFKMIETPEKKHVFIIKQARPYTN
ncbi:MAG: hypothetical protein JST26_00680 [Bacteroidetes bacterium]|nr:hypothetical protein [Bacteroidota bacterium]